MFFGSFVFFCVTSSVSFTGFYTGGSNLHVAGRRSQVAGRGLQVIVSPIQKVS